MSSEQAPHVPHQLKLYPPPASAVAGAHVSGMAAYEKLCAEAEADYEAYWARRTNVEDCAACRKQPAGFALCHEEDARLALDYDAARRQIETAPGDPEVTAVLAEVTS